MCSLQKKNHIPQENIHIFSNRVSKRWGGLSLFCFGEGKFVRKTGTDLVVAGVGMVCERWGGLSLFGVNV